MTAIVENGVQRIALGTGALGADAVPVSASNPLPVGGLVSAAKAASSTTANVAAAAVDTLILAANTSRLPGSTITNDSTSILYLRLGSSAASATDYTVQIDGKTSVPGSYVLPDGWTGAVRGIWVSATGSARVTELSA